MHFCLGLASTVCKADDSCENKAYFFVDFGFAGIGVSVAGVFRGRPRGRLATGVELLLLSMFDTSKALAVGSVAQ